MHVLRNEDGKIIGAFELPQVGMKLDFVKRDDQEFLDFIESTQP